MTLKSMLALTAVAVTTMVLCVGCKDAKKVEAPAAEPTTVTAVPTEPTAAPIIAEPQIGVIEASSLIVRDGPGFDYSSPGGVQEGDEVVIVDRDGDWYKIEFGDTFGYIHSQYVSVEGQSTHTLKPTTTTTTKAPTTTTVAGTTVTDKDGNVVTVITTQGTTVTDKNGNVVTATTAKNSGTTTTTVTNVQGDNTEIDYEGIPGVEVIDQW